jgi:hypothetical protein
MTTAANLYNRHARKGQWTPRIPRRVERLGDDSRGMVYEPKQADRISDGRRSAQSRIVV